MGDYLSQRGMAKAPSLARGVRELPLTKGLFATVDEADHDRVSQFKWTALCSPHTTYARRTVRGPNGKQKTLYLHRFILNAPEGLEVDHRDRNGLNNTRDNLRTATGSNNQHNRGISKNNTSGIKGVSWSKSAQKWVATITCNWEQTHLGFFETKGQAAEAYAIASRILHKDFSCLTETTTS